MATARTRAPRPAAMGGAAAGHGASPLAIGEIVVGFVDPSRRVPGPGGRPRPRPLVTVIRYPATGTPSPGDTRDAPPATAMGPFPLIVFGHGFAATPALYESLLRAWVRAGYVVAAPLFPLSNAHAPGGPDEADLINQPADMSYVITRMLTASASGHGLLARLVDPRRIAVAGQSDGGSTALAVAYNRRFADRRVSAAVVLSGARIPGLTGYDFAARGPALLAAQGTADLSNAPASTLAFFRPARPPKFLLQLLGAGHLAPYTRAGRALHVVEMVTVAFFDRYLKHEAGADRRLLAAGNAPGVAAVSTGG